MDSSDDNRDGCHLTANGADENETRHNEGDRRRRPTSPLDALRWNGRRVQPRREQERRGTYFVDRFDAWTFAMIVGLLALTIIDGVLTLELLDTNSEEANPLMAHLLQRGDHVFLIGKYVLTAAGLPFVVVYKNYPMFGTCFRVGFVLPLFVGLYIVLVFYQTVMISICIL